MAYGPYVAPGWNTDFAYDVISCTCLALRSFSPHWAAGFCDAKYHDRHDGFGIRLFGSR